MRVLPLSSLPSRLGSRAADVAPGLILALGVAAVGSVVGVVVPLVGSALPALLIGVAIAVIRRPRGRWAPGIGYASKFVLQCAVVLLGTQLSLVAIATVGVESLPVMLSSLVVCLVAAWLVGAALRVPSRERTLIGVGTGICGASAIAAVSPIIGAASAEIAYAVSTIFLFNVVAVLVFPLIGHALGMDPHVFALFAGTAVNDTSSVVAVAGLFSATALGFAVVVKLVRTLMIIPISIGLAIVAARRRLVDERFTFQRAVGLVPWFLVGFIVVAALCTVAPPPPAAHEVLVQISVFLIATALAAIGMSTDVGAIRRAGWRPLLLGLILWMLVTLTSLLVIWITGGGSFSS